MDKHPNHPRPDVEPTEPLQGRTYRSPGSRTAQRQAMDHRVGRRWRADRSVSVFKTRDTASDRGRLVELSHNGGRLQLHHLKLQRGDLLQVRPEGIAGEVRAMVVHVHDTEAGLLWVERPLWLQRLLQSAQHNPGRGLRH